MKVLLLCIILIALHLASPDRTKEDHNAEGEGSGERDGKRRPPPPNCSGDKGDRPNKGDRSKGDRGDHPPPPTSGPGGKGGYDYNTGDNEDREKRPRPDCSGSGRVGGVMWICWAGVLLLLHSF